MDFMISLSMSVFCIKPVRNRSLANEIIKHKVVKEERSKINDLRVHLKILKKRNKASPK